MEEWSFAEEIRLRPINLPRAALYMARSIAYPQLAVEESISKINELTAAARLFLKHDQGSFSRAALLSEFMFQQWGFKGNRVDYGDPRNSYLNEVLQRRLGIPITLSLLFVEVARRLDVPAYGVALPGHFIVAVQEDREIHYFDPFHGGNRLSVADCARLVQQAIGHRGPFVREWLDPANEEDILVRMLNNLRINYVRDEEWPKALRVIEHLRLLQPQSPEHIRDLGLVYYRQRSMRLAAEYLDRYLAQAPEADDADDIRDGMSEMLDQWVRMN